MDERWTRIGELFDAARALPVEQREAWLRSNCDDEDLFGEVLALLRAYDEDPAFLERPVSAQAAGAALRAAAAVPLEGRRFGPYRLVREVGRGGMGVVYEAEHTDAEFTRNVAVKLVPSGWSATSLVSRFKYERRVLARLDHPGIARLLDAGTTDDGTPYFVMEYVDGRPIDAWCRERGLGLRERIALVLRVCEAVEHAHRNFVVHRDLKAANILITADGQPKLLDFGIAKMLSDEAESTGGLTVTGQAAFTPAYASPEQVRGEGVTTGSDVYSLGVLLYVLLVERLPYETARLSPLEAMRAVCEQDPAVPSVVAPIESQRMLRGDLDNILLLALRKDPGERYGSVHALADDLRAWGDGRPVSASPGTLWYRTRKFVARRRAQTLAAVAVVLAIAAGGVATAWQARVARIERDKAESRFQQVRQFSRTVLFELHDAIRGLPGATPARQLLITRAVQFLDDLSRDAGNDLALKLELAEGYRKLGHVQGSSFSENVGDTAGALVSFKKAARLGEEVLARKQESIPAAILLTGAYDDLTTAAWERGDRTAAEEAHRRHRAIVTGLEGTGANDSGAQASIASSYSHLAFYRGTQEDWAEAKSLYAKSIALYERLHAPGTAPHDVVRLREYGFALKRLGAIHLKERNHEEAERRYAAALEIDNRVVAIDAQNEAYKYDATFTLSDLALIARRRGDFARAESLWMRALAVRKAALAADPKNTRARAGVANIQGRLGGLYRDQRRTNEAIGQFREHLRLREELVAIEGAIPGAIAASAEARLYLVASLLDRAQTERGAPRADSLREARLLLSAVEPVARRAKTDRLPGATYITTTFEEQTARLRRFGG